MAIIPVTPATISTGINSAQAGDVIELGPGTYPSLPRRSGLAYRAQDAGEPGRAVKDVRGHLGQGFGVRVTDYMGGSYSGTTFEGIFFDAREQPSSRGINWALLTGTGDVGFIDCSFTDRPEDGGRRIGITPLGGSAPFDGLVIERCRFYRTGKFKDTHDHPLYLKRARNVRVVDSIFHDAGWFTLHLYPDCDDSRFERLVIWASGSAVAFSAENSGANPSAGITGASERNILSGSILGAGHGRPGGQSGGGGFLVESYAPSAGPRPVGNIVERCFLTRFGGTAQLVQPGISDRVALADVILSDADPGFSDLVNGDFRLRAGAAALGFGPSYIQPQGAPPPDPEPEPEPPAPSNPHRISPALKDAISDMALRRMDQQTGRAEALAQFLERKGHLRRAELTREIGGNAARYLTELADLLAGSEDA